MTKQKTTAARVYVPHISVLTLAAAGAFLLFGLATVIWMFVDIHPIAGLGAGAVFSAIAYTAAESHAASQRIPADVQRSGSSFTDPEDQDDEPTARYGPDSGRW